MQEALLAYSKLALEKILFSSNCKEEGRRQDPTLPRPSWLDCGEGSAAGNVVVCAYALEQIGLTTRFAVMRAKCLGGLEKIYRKDTDGLASSSLRFHAGPCRALPAGMSHSSIVLIAISLSVTLSF